MKLLDKLPAPVSHFLMLDVYKKASSEDREFLDVMLFVGRIINALANPISFIWLIGSMIVKY